MDESPQGNSGVSRLDERDAYFGEHADRQPVFMGGPSILVIKEDTSAGCLEALQLDLRSGLRGKEVTQRYYDGTGNRKKTILSPGVQYPIVWNGVQLNLRVSAETRDERIQVEIAQCPERVLFVDRSTLANAVGLRGRFMFFGSDFEELVAFLEEDPSIKRSFFERPALLIDQQITYRFLGL